jgi:hypothetical protein
MIQLRKIPCCKRMPSFFRQRVAPQLGEVHGKRFCACRASLRVFGALGRIAIFTNPAAAI